MTRRVLGSREDAIRARVASLRPDRWFRLMREKYCNVTEGRSTPVHEVVLVCRTERRKLFF